MPRSSLIPRRMGFCATIEKDWQGNPPVKISKSGSSLLGTVRISRLSGLIPKFFSKIALALTSISLAYTISISLEG